MAFNLSMNASDIDKTLVDSRKLLDSEPATKQYVDEKATWENLQGKPTIFEGGDTLTWDGDTEGKTLVFDMGYKVSDATPTLSDTGNGVTMTMDNGAVIPSSAIVCEEAEGLLMFNVEGVPYAFVVHAYEDLPTGTYLTAGVSSLTIPGYTGFGKEVIDPDYLPESVKGGSGGVVYVNITASDSGAYSADKSFEDVEADIAAGKNIFAVVAEGPATMFLPLCWYMPGAGAEFTMVSLITGTTVLYQATITPDGVQFNTTSLSAST